jgi:hypothetical protein
MAKPVSPVIEGMGEFEVIYAKDQPPYLPLPVLKVHDGKILCRWELDAEDRKKIWDGADVYITVLPCGGPLQPHKVEIGFRDDGPESLSHCELSKRSRLIKVAAALEWIASQTETVGSEYGMPHVASRADEAAKLVREELKEICGPIT